MTRPRRPPASALVVFALTVVLAAAVGAAASGQPRTGSSTPPPGLGDCPVFPQPPSSLPPGAPSLPNEAAWNQDVSRAPLAPDSAAIIAYIDAHGGDHLHPDFGSPRSYGIPFRVVGSSQRRLPVRYTAYGAESDRGPFPIPPNAPVEGGRRSNGDRHVLVVDRSSCMLYELARAFFRRLPRPHWAAAVGVSWNLRSPARRPDGWTSADAAGLPIFPGLVRFDEVASGRLNHAIRVTFESTRNAWVHPGSHCAGDTSNPHAPAMGMRLRLAPRYPLARFSGEALVIGQALKRYGLIVADNGSNWYIGGSSDRRWNDVVLDQLKRIPGSAFQVVESAAPVHAC